MTASDAEWLRHNYLSRPRPEIQSAMTPAQRLANVFNGHPSPQRQERVVEEGPPATVPRDPRFEDDMREAAARTWRVPADAIAAMASARTMPGPIRDRDMNLEAREEFSDSFNYIPWDLLRHLLAATPGVEEAQPHYANALGAAIYAFEELRTAHRIMQEAGGG